jgi:hypothetical protein
MLVLAVFEVYLAMEYYLSHVPSAVIMDPADDNILFVRRLNMVKRGVKTDTSTTTFFCSSFPLVQISYRATLLSIAAWRNLVILNQAKIVLIV